LKQLDFLNGYWFAVAAMVAMIIVVVVVAVGWLLIMTTVGKTHAVKYTKEATLTKPIHY